MSLTYKNAERSVQVGIGDVRRAVHRWSFPIGNDLTTTLCDSPFDVVQFSCGECLRNGRYKESVLIEKYTADIPVPDLRTHIAHGCQRMMTTTGTDPCAISNPDLLKAHLDGRNAEASNI